jgi:hypothetical protein
MDYFDFLFHDKARIEEEKWRYSKKAFLRQMIISTSLILFCQSTDRNQWIVYDRFDGLGNGKHIVLISGDEEYRSEESILQLTKILARHHGFKCTVLFAINKETGEIDPETLDNIPGLHLLKTAALMVLYTRFRNLPKDQMNNFLDYINSGNPILGLKTATHAFNIPKDRLFA